MLWKMTSQKDVKESIIDIIGSNYSASHDLTPSGGLAREFLLFQGNLVGEILFPFGQISYIQALRGSCSLFLVGLYKHHLCKASTLTSLTVVSPIVNDLTYVLLVQVSAKEEGVFDLFVPWHRSLHPRQLYVE